MAQPTLPRIPSLEEFVPHAKAFEDLKSQHDADIVANNNSLNEAIIAVNRDMKICFEQAEASVRNQFNALACSFLRPIKNQLEESRQGKIEEIQNQYREKAEARNRQYYNNLHVFMGSIAPAAEPPSSQGPEDLISPTAASREHSKLKNKRGGVAAGRISKPTASSRGSGVGQLLQGSLGPIRWISGEGIPPILRQQLEQQQQQQQQLVQQQQQLIEQEQEQQQKQQQ